MADPLATCKARYQQCTAAAGGDPKKLVQCLFEYVQCSLKPLQRIAATAAKPRKPKKTTGKAASRKAKG